MTDSRRDFLLRFAASALAAAGAGCAAPVEEVRAEEPLREQGPMVVYGPPPVQRQDAKEDFATKVGSRVLFAKDKTALSDQAKAILDRQVEWLTRNSGYAIILEGNTDDRCAREYCIPLSERQARLVRDYMVAHGIASERITVIGFGRERPAVMGKTEAARSQNRRVDTVLQER